MLRSQHFLSHRGLPERVFSFVHKFHLYDQIKSTVRNESLEMKVMIFSSYNTYLTSIAYLNSAFACKYDLAIEPPRPILHSPP